MADSNNIILEEYFGEDEDGVQAQRFVQLSASYNSYTVQQHVAALRTGGATITYLNSNKKPKHFGLTAQEMDEMVEAWVNFKADMATLKAAQEAEKLEKFKATWAEITNLADSIPGMEIYAKPDDTWHNYDTNEEEPYTVVRVPAIGFERRYALPEKTLAGVKDAIEAYQSYVQLYEKYENQDWYGCTHKSKENGQNFLKQYREWLTEKQETTA